MDPNTETANNQPPKNDAQATAPTVDNGNAAEIERLRREAEQSKMRANQLENELAAKKAADDDVRRKQLEENEEFKALYEREKSERERIESETKEAKRKAGLSSAQSEIFAKFPKEVVDVAETTGLSLSDDSDDAKQQFEAKLKTLQEKVSPKRPPTGNNQGMVTPTTPERAQLLDGVRRGNPQAVRTAISSLESLKAMRQNAGVEQVVQ